MNGNNAVKGINDGCYLASMATHSLLVSSADLGSARTWTLPSPKGSPLEGEESKWSLTGTLKRSLRLREGGWTGIGIETSLITAAEFGSQK